MPESFEFEEGEVPAKYSKPDWRKRAEKFFDNSSFTGVLYMFASKSCMAKTHSLGSGGAGRRVLEDLQP